MHYDREKRLVVTKAFVDPALISSAKIDDVHKLLTEQGANYCTDGLAMAEAEAAEIQAVSDVGKDCSVDFFTWTLDRAGQITTKTVATMQGNQLILK